jgi:hypothetical protein
MNRAAGIALLVAVTLIPAAGAVRAAAPSAKEYMQPLDTSAGSISDPKKLLKTDLDRTVKVSVSAMPIEVAFNQLNAMLGIEFGYGEGITPQLPVTLNMSGKGRDVLKALGGSAGIRFEANGPSQLRAVRARAKAPLRQTPPAPKPQ